MAVTQDCILYPLRYTVATRTLSVTVNSSTENLTLAAMVADRNYWTSDDDQADASTNGGVGDLVDIFQTMLNTHTQTSAFSASFTSPAGTNLLKITCDQDYTLNWTNGSTTADAKTLGADLGFDTTSDTTSSGSSFTLPNNSKGIWNPGKPRSTDDRDRQGYVGSIARTTTGIQRTTRLAVPAKHRAIGWSLIPKAKALDEYAASTEATGAFESAFDDAISLGRRFRVYDNATSRTSSSYTLYRSTSLADPLARDSRERQTRWTVDLELVVA